MYKKTTILALGNYQGVNGFEDYDLWIRLVQAGYHVDNLDEVLVYVRIGNNMIGRRSGFAYIRKEINFLYVQKCRHFISTIEFILLLLFRIPVRLLPKKILSSIYSNFLR